MAKICAQCGTKMGMMDGTELEGLKVCNNCKDTVRAQLQKRKEILESGSAERMIAVTTPEIEGCNVNQYLGIVSGRAVLGVNFLRDMFASVRDFWGGRSRSLQREFARAENTAIREAKVEAAVLGGDAVLDVSVDYETIDTGNGGYMIMVVATGTVVATT